MILNPDDLYFADCGAGIETFSTLDSRFPTPAERTHRTLHPDST